MPGECVRVTSVSQCVSIFFFFNFGQRRLALQTSRSREIFVPLPPGTVSTRLLSLLKCCFTSTETVGLLGTGAQDGHLDFHTATELWGTRLGHCHSRAGHLLVCFGQNLFNPAQLSPKRFPNGGATDIVFVTLFCLAVRTAIAWCRGLCAMPDDTA